jgi:formylglycine-generating enzyme required for sulfatase activity
MSFRLSHDAPRRWLALNTILLVGCAAAPLGLAPAPAHLDIANPERWPLRLATVIGDALVPCRELGSGATASLTLSPGAYVLWAATEPLATAMPVPLLETSLPEDRRLQLRIAAPPAAEAAFAFVPAGPAVIGDTLGVGQPEERPARIVEVPAFWLGRCEVTNAEYAAFLTAVEPNVDAAWCAFDSRKCRVRRDATSGGWRTDAPQLPIVTVSFAGAEAYCAWRTGTTGVRHRLPSEIEWEKAARGPESFVYAFGNIYRRAAANAESGALRAVGGYAPNGFGLFDMTGNAFEWTGDPWPAMPNAQILRGGSFVLDGMYLRNSLRMWQSRTVRTDDFGFRVARDAAPASDSRASR